MLMGLEDWRLCVGLALRTPLEGEPRKAPLVVPEREGARGVSR